MATAGKPYYSLPRSVRREENGMSTPPEGPVETVCLLLEFIYVAAKRMSYNNNALLEVVES
jgi:hypothetical protein